MTFGMTAHAFATCETDEANEKAITGPRLRREATAPTEDNTTAIVFETWRLW